MEEIQCSSRSSIHIFSDVSSKAVIPLHRENKRSILHFLISRYPMVLSARCSKEIEVYRPLTASRRILLTAKFRVNIGYLTRPLWTALLYQMWVDFLWFFFQQLRKELGLFVVKCPSVSNAGIFTIYFFTIFRASGQGMITSERNFKKIRTKIKPIDVKTAES